MRCYMKKTLEGSIPARAGEPLVLIVVIPPYRVYPRTCGGTDYSDRANRAAYGLSPHVRGNLASSVSACNLMRSIPARAGEPPAWRRQGRDDRVYPRTCGGTIRATQLPVAVGGLSPHVRGNHACYGILLPLLGSIPARAGEPPPSPRPGCPPGVYPRTCGGTCRWSKDGRSIQGLSPHVRGNPDAARDHVERAGSIPARAGEPTRWCAAAAGGGVYPRTCGGTCNHLRAKAVREGLSPHVRGNPVSPRSRGDAEGSIPARAGEPWPTPLFNRPRWVYPRTCGGTGAP